MSKEQLDFWRAITIFGFFCGWPMGFGLVGWLLGHYDPMKRISESLRGQRPGNTADGGDAGQSALATASRLVNWRRQRRQD